MLNLKRTEIEVQDKQVTIWLNQPEKRNALNLTNIEEIIKIFKWTEKQKEIIVILIRGKGKSFCTGADINWMISSGLREYQDSYLVSKKLAECFKTIYKSDKIVINLVHGDVFGGALGFLGAADFTLAAKNTRFRLPELRLGLAPSVIMPYLLTRIKAADLKYLSFSGDIFTVDESLKTGLIDKVCEDIEDMEVKVNELIHNISFLHLRKP